MAGRCVFGNWKPRPGEARKDSIGRFNHLNLAEVELLISKDFADALDSPRGDEEMMEIMSNGEQIGINHDMNGPADDGDL